MLRCWIFHFSRKKELMALLFCFALVIWILYGNKVYYWYSSATLNLHNWTAEDAGDDTGPSHDYNSPPRLILITEKENNGQYTLAQPLVATSHDKLLTTQFPPFSNISKYFLYEERIPPNNALTSLEHFLSWVNIQPVPPYHVHYLLNHPELCPNKGANLTVLMAVITAVDHKEARSVIRETWGGYARDRGVKLLFFVGIPQRSKFKKRLIREDRKFHDIIQSDFVDSYGNLTLKILSMLKWVSEFCPEVKYVNKIDDDVFLNVENILDLASHKNASKSIMGHLLHDHAPTRSKSSKWYVPYSVYPFAKYPDYINGPFYFIRGETINALFNATVKLIYVTNISFCQFEDVCVTGLAAEMIGIKRINLDGVYSFPEKIQHSSFQRLFSSTSHSPKDIREKWISLKKSNFTCTE